MSDLRGLSRGSKAAAVVVLVVLAQVIVVAVLGLDAIGRDRDEGARRGKVASAERSRALARRIVERTASGLVGAVEASARVASVPGGLRSLPKDGWLAAVEEIYRVDVEGRVRAAGGTLLHVPAEVVEATERRVDRAARASFDRALSGAGTDAASLEMRRRYVAQFPFTVDDDGSRYARAVGEALRLAKDVAAGASGPLSVTDAVLLAYETAAINDHRPLATQPGFPVVAAELRALVAALDEPLRRTLGDLLTDLDRARASLVGFLDLTLPLAKEAAASASPTRILAWRRGSAAGPGRRPEAEAEGAVGASPAFEIVGFAPLPRAAGAASKETLLARLDRRAIRTLAVSSAVVPDGAVVRIVPRETARDAELAVEGARLPIESPDADAGFDVVVERAGPVTDGEVAGPRETFYWFILGLATLGVSIAGVFLVRILRREVDLARLKADFVSNLSHELKTPLTSISLFTEMMRDGALVGADLDEGIAVISSEAERLRRIVSRMIDVARREAEGTGYDRRPSDVNDPVKKACERFRRLETDPGLALDVDLAPSLPLVLLDEGAIDDAVTNLLSNAWKYRRGDRARIRVSTRRRGRGVEVAVADDGIGIPRRERRRIFEMFYRAESYLSRGVPGTGLGLALVRTIVRVHRGRIRVETADGGGSVFRVRFPAAPRGARRAARAEPADSSPPSARTGERGAALVAGAAAAPTSAAGDSA